MSFQKDFDHDITIKMLRNNLGFYNDVRNKNFDIRLFEPTFKKWCPKQVVSFLAFGKIMDKNLVIQLLEKWVPNFKAQFWWFVILNKIKNGM